MKQLLPSLFVLFSIAAIGQNNNPFESIGKESAMLSLSNGRYEEVFKNDKYRRVGSVMMNTETMKIDHFLSAEELKECQNLETEKQASRFLSVDPLANKFPFYTPYQFAGNKPIVAIDLDGLEDLWVHYIQQEDGTLIVNKTAQMLTEEQNRMYSETWGVNIPKTGVVYTMASSQTRQTQIVYTGVTAVVTAKGTPREEKKAEIKHDGIQMMGNTMYEGEGEEGFHEFTDNINDAGQGIQYVGQFAGPFSKQFDFIGETMGRTADVFESVADFEKYGLEHGTENLKIRLLSNAMQTGIGEIGKRGGSGQPMLDKSTKIILDKSTDVSKDQLIKENNDKYYENKGIGKVNR